MSADADIHAALMARLETLSGVTVLYPRKGGKVPTGEYVRASVVPNDNLRTRISNETVEARGFLVLTLVSDLDEHEVKSKAVADQIKDHFPIGYNFRSNGTSVKCMNRSVRTPRQEGGRWETPIWIEYRGYVAA